MTSQTVILGMLWGISLGMFYFGGLWLTVRRVPGSGSPRLLLLLSFVFRAAAAVTCFFLILQQGLVMFGTAVFFFFLFRFLVTAILSKPMQRRMHAN